MWKRAHGLMLGILLTCGMSVANAASTDDFINQAFNDLLGRPPTSMELSSYEALLSTSTRQEAAYQIETATPEFHERVVNGLYSLLLLRSPTSSEESQLTGDLDSGETIEQVEAGIAGTPEYFTNRGGDSDSGFLTAIFSDLLDRAPAVNEQKFYESQLAGSVTTGQVAAEILATAEYQEDLVGEYAQNYLHAPLSTADADSYVNELQSNVRDEVVISQIIGSDQYFANLPEPAGFSMLLGTGLLIRVRRSKKPTS